MKQIRDITVPFIAGYFMGIPVMAQCLDTETWGRGPIYTYDHEGD